MERVSFIVTATGARISCLLNPEHVVQRRTAGLRRPWAATGPVSGAMLTDDILLHTGGGTTEVDLDLLFDTELAGDRTTTEVSTFSDVRELTRPLWNLAENSTDGTTGASPTGSGGRTGPVGSVRFFWGDRWNFLCVVLAVAERLERFDASGAPSRSWLRLRLRRIPDPSPPPMDPVAGSSIDSATLAELAATAPAQDFHTTLGAGTDAEGGLIGAERLDELASRYYPGRPWLWRLIAAANNLDAPPWAPAGVSLVIPAAPTEGP